MGGPIEGWVVGVKGVGGRTLTDRPTTERHRSVFIPDERDQLGRSGIIWLDDWGAVAVGPRVEL